MVPRAFGESCAEIAESLRFDIAVTMVTRIVWSHSCDWTELSLVEPVCEQARQSLVLTAEWPGRWTVTARFTNSSSPGDVVVPVRDLVTVPIVGREPVRRFSWHRAQRHRPGLQFLVSTGRLHGYESLAEARLLLMLDFAGGVTEVLSQPLRLRFFTRDGPREHIPDFFTATRTGRLLIDVRPGGRIEPRDEVAFAAAAEVALLAGWGYAVVVGWLPHTMSTVDALSAQRRSLTDRFGMVDALLDARRMGRARSVSWPQRHGLRRSLARTCCICCGIGGWAWT